jgi:two-component system sensor histidine kinase/response regulator
MLFSAALPNGRRPPDRTAREGFTLESFEAPMEENAPLLDIEVLDKLESIMPRDRLIVIASSFLNGVIARADRIAMLAGDHNFERLGREAHDLKSTSGSFGARRLQYFSEQLEAACRDSDVTAARELAAAITAVLPETLQAVLRRYPQVRFVVEPDDAP